ncbi:MAG: glycosyltransferase family 2 protein [Chthoniobacterales bacterium]|nr:glycosyltransferase family 2 protein [Chthoniobacterales bacterium]
MHYINDIKEKKFLSIAIPTYNRVNHVKQRIEELLPQLNDETQIIIYDNGSDEINDLLKYIDNKRVFYKRSISNLGMTGNFLRCMTQTLSEWIWVLGDDDPVKDNCLKTILGVLKKTEASIVNFTTDACFNNSNKLILNLSELLMIKDVSSLLHFSSNVYKLETVKKTFHVLATSCFTYAMHVVIITKALENIPDCKMELRVEEILKKNNLNPRRWSTLEVAMGLSVYPCFVNQIDLKKICSNQLRASTRWMLLWALGDIKNINEIGMWKLAVKFTNNNLKVFGSSLLNHFYYFISKNKNFKDFYRDFFLSILLLLPKNLIYYIAKYMRSRFLKTNQREYTVLSEFK